MSRRFFTLIEGTSSKFWAITLEGTTHTVEFGRIGTAGQSSRKDFGTEAEAKTSHDKLVAEKVKKGYTEKDDDAAEPVSPVASSIPSTPKPKAKAKTKVGEPGIVAEDAPASIAEPTLALASETLVMADRSLDLEPMDWVWASWKPFEPVVPPEPKPFGRDEAMAWLQNVVLNKYKHVWEWSKVQFSTYPSEEESKFWISVFDHAKNSRTHVKFFARIETASETFDKSLSFSELNDCLKHFIRLETSEIAVLVFRTYPIDECLDYWANSSVLQDIHRELLIERGIFDGFRQFIRPTLDADQVRELRDKVRPRLVIPKTPPGRYNAYPMAWYLAASLGLSDEVAALVQTFPDSQYVGKDNYSAYYHRPQWLVLGLRDPAKIEAEWRRLGLPHTSPEEVRAWLATTGFNGLDLIRNSILAKTNKDDALALLNEFARARGPEVAPLMLELLLESKAPRVARQWLDDNPSHAIAGLIATAAGKGKLADEALEFLREQKRKGREAFIRQCLETASAEAADKIRREVLERVEIVIEPLDEATTPEALKTAMVESAKLKPPAWISAEALPRILVGDRAMTEKQISSLLAGLVKSALAAPLPIVRAVREHADRASLDAFAWALFERWQRDGAPPKEKWAMLALGLLGSDGSALKLTPLIRAWPGESQHARAVVGLECLRAIGTDGAMMRLNGIAQKLSFKGLKAKAAEMMEAIAQDRNMTRAELEDRIVPDCELDERGSRVFDFGPRQFTFVLGSEMKPMVRDADGKLKPDLPKPTSKDDQSLASAAVDAWKLLKKQIKEVTKVQAERLEQAMVVGRRWSPEDFETLLVKHPLMIHLVRMVVWGGYDASGKLVLTFRVTDERDYADVNEKSVSIAGLARVGIVHPLHLSQADTSSWGEIFGDYEIIPPFPQLGRSVHRLEPGEETLKTLKGRVTGKLEGVTLVGILERLGWARGIPEDAGIFHEHSKAFEGANVTAVIQYSGVPVGYMLEAEPQDIEECFFLSGIYTPKMYPDHRNALPLGRVDPVVISEVLGTLGALASKTS